MPTSDHDSRASSQIGPSGRLAAVTPADDADLPGGVARSLFVGVAGVLAILDAAGGEVELHSADSQYHPVRVRRVLARTTATGIVALY